MILVVDNYDSFTWNLVDYIQQCGEEVSLVRNNIHPREYRFPTLKGIILSPGPGKPNQAGHLLSIIKFFEGKLPILGICLGHQAIGEVYGATVERAPVPVHGKVSSVSCCTDNLLFSGLPPVIEAVRYHSLVLNNLPNCLTVLATTDNLVMAIRHKHFPTYGIQFHPEAYLTKSGINIIQNWITLCRK